MPRLIFASTPDLRPSLLSVLQGLADSGRLAGVATTIALTSLQIRTLSRFPVVGRRLGSMLHKRQTPDFLVGKVDAIWPRELVRSASAKIAPLTVTHKIWKWSEIGFDRTVAKRYGGQFDVVYGMEHSSAATFMAQKARGGRCVLRQVTAHARTVNSILRGQVEQFPGLTASYYRKLLAEEEEITLRKQAEYDLADLIVANSDYVRKTFIANGVPEEKVISIPTGCPRVDDIGARRGNGAGVLRFLYVGTLSLRKGFPYLLEAWRTAGLGAHAELWLAGNSELDVRTISQEPGIRYFGMLSSEKLRDLYRQSDVFVLPTLCEGLAHAVLEALSFGLPVITTEASGAGDLVVNGDNGAVVPEADGEALAVAMSRAITGPTLLSAMGVRSAERARWWTRARSNAEHLDRIRAFLDEGR